MRFALTFLVTYSNNRNILRGTEVLINELIQHNKQFSMFSYPNRSHSISEGSNTTRHLFSLLTNFLETNVPSDIRAMDNE